MSSPSWEVSRRGWELTCRDVEELINWAPRFSPNKIKNVTDKLLCWNWVLLALKDPTAELHLIIQPTHFLSPTLDNACMLSSFSRVWFMDYTHPGFSVLRIFQARILKWVAISSSRGSSQPRDRTHIPCLGRWDFTTSSTLPCKSYTACNGDSANTLYFWRVRQKCDSYR